MTASSPVFSLDSKLAYILRTSLKACLARLESPTGRLEDQMAWNEPIKVMEVLVVQNTQIGDKLSTIFYKLLFTHVILIFHLFGKIPSQSVELNLWSGVHQILTAMLRKSDVTWWPHLQEKRLGKLVQRILTKPLIGHWVTRWTTGKAGRSTGKATTASHCTHVDVRKRGFLKTITSRALMLVNAHVPFKDGTVLSLFSVTISFSCGRAKNDSKPQRVDADVSEKRRKRSPFSDKNGYVWTGSKLNKTSRFYILHFLGGEVRDWRKNILV